MQKRTGILLLAFVLVLLGVVTPPGTLRFLIRSPIVLVSDLISAIRQAFAPSEILPATSYVLTTGQPPASVTPIVPRIGSFAGATASTNEAAPALPRRPLPIPTPVPENPVLPPGQPLPDPGGVLPPPEQVLDPVENILDPVLGPVEKALDPVLGPVEKAIEPVVNTVEKAVEPVVGAVEKAVELVTDGGVPDVGVPDVTDTLDKLGLGGK